MPGWIIMLDEVYKQLTALQKQIDNLVKPETPVPGLSFIVETVLTGTAASVTFGDIPQTFRHLQLVCQARSDRATESDQVLLRFNGDTGANYDFQFITANSATVSSLATRAATSIQVGLAEAANSRAANFAPIIIFIPGYVRGGAERWILSQAGVFGDVSADTDLFMRDYRGRWRDTDPITSITILPNVGPNFVSGSRFQLYGIY